MMLFAVFVSQAPLVLLLILGAFVFVACTTKHGGRALGMLLGACFLAFLFMAVLWGSYANVQATNDDIKVAEAEARSTEEMWEEMHRPRIKLSVERESEPRTSTKSQITPVAAREPEGHASDSPAAKDETDVEASVKRPDWVDLPPKRVGNVYRAVLVSGRYTRVDECHKNLDNRLRQVVEQRLEQLVGWAHFHSIESLGLSLDYVWSNICREEWIETVDTSVGEMKRVHVLLEFDAAVDRHLERAYRSYRSSVQSEELGVVVAVVLGILVGMYALLKIDTWTRGYYTKRLFFGVPAAIILLLIIANS